MRLCRPRPAPEVLGVILGYALSPQRIDQFRIHFGFFGWQWKGFWVILLLA